MTLQELRNKHGKKVIPFFRPNKGTHESGWGTFDVGYCSADGEDEVILNSGSDHIGWFGPMLEGTNDKKRRLPSLNMDVDDHGRIRLYRGFEWENDCVFSSALINYKGDFTDQ